MEFYLYLCFDLEKNTDILLGYPLLCRKGHKISNMLFRTIFFFYFIPQFHKILTQIAESVDTDQLAPAV